MNEETIQLLGRTNFSNFDWAIVGLYLAASVCIGLLVRKYIANMSDYVTAGRSLGTALGVATMTGSELGLVTVVYSAQKGSVGGFAAFHIAVLAAIVTFLVRVSGFIVYRLRAMEVMTIPEFYERRFGRKTRILGGVMLALGGILNMGLFLKVGLIFIVGITGLSAEGWALPAIMTVLLGLVLLYTVLGGMVSVVITDYIQFVVLSIGLLVVTGFAIVNLGWQNIFDTVAREMGEKGFNPLVAEGSFGVDYVVWMSFLGLVSCGIWPTAVARSRPGNDRDPIAQFPRWTHHHWSDFLRNGNRFSPFSGHLALTHSTRQSVSCFFGTRENPLSSPLK